MPYVEVHVDAEDVLDDLGDEEIAKELQRRRDKSGVTAQDGISAADARLTLDEAAFRFRKLGRFDLAFKLDEIRHDHF